MKYQCLRTHALPRAVRKLGRSIAAASQLRATGQTENLPAIDKIKNRSTYVSSLFNRDILEEFWLVRLQ
jgi:hypothetical protein